MSMEEVDFTGKATKESQTIRLCLISLECKQQLLDLLRDVPMPRKVSDPLFNALASAPSADFDVNKLQEASARGQ